MWLGHSTQKDTDNGLLKFIKNSLLITLEGDHMTWRIEKAQKKEEDQEVYFINYQDLNSTNISFFKMKKVVCDMLDNC